MQRMMLKSKIHRATVTDTCLHYEGSLGVDITILKEADILEGEQVQIYNINNGKRFETYTIQEAPNSGKIVIYGAAARLAEPGDLLIIAAFALIEDKECQNFSPIKISVDNNNRIIKK